MGNTLDHKSALGSTVRGNDLIVTEHVNIATNSIMKRHEDTYAIYPYFPMNGLECVGF